MSGMMELPQCLSSVSPRSMEDIAAAALASQANVVSLRVALERRGAVRGDLADIRTPAPGAVLRFREILIDREMVKSYSADEAFMRLRQVWGEYNALCWLFPFCDPQAPIDFHELSPAQTIRCCQDLHAKLDEVQRLLWRIRLEMRVRFDDSARGDPALQSEFEYAQMNPVRIFGHDIRMCDQSIVFAAACEHAGMLAALRWAGDDRWNWEAPGIMDVVLTD